MGTLYGLQPAKITRCRVLELGCAGGMNLLPMAEELPDSNFTGIDLSANQIAEARGIAIELGLDNLDLIHDDIRAIDETWGEFDYIICHGVYSWVSADVRQKILRTCNRNLAPQGIAMISYNTNPGWHFHRMIRDMMLYHIRAVESPPPSASSRPGH